MFKFELNQRVIISASHESGTVIGRAQFANAEDSFFVRYKAADGRAVEEWWTEQALEADE